MMIALERVWGIMFLCYGRACTPAGSEHALFCGFLICHTRWESDSCYCCVIQYANPFLAAQNASWNLCATQCFLQNCRQLLITVLFHIFLQMLIRNILDCSIKWGSTALSVDSPLHDRKNVILSANDSEYFKEIYTFQQDYFSLVSFLGIDQLEKKI